MSWRSTTACDQRPLAINDHLRSTTACDQRPLAINDRSTIKEGKGGNSKACVETVTLISHLAHASL
eukprot:8741343-Heterocapsa_arctica.AAC.1